MAVVALHRGPGSSFVLLKPSLQLVSFCLTVADCLLGYLSHLRIFAINQLGAGDVDDGLLVWQQHARELDIMIEVFRIGLSMTIDANALGRCRIVEGSL